MKEIVKSADGISYFKGEEAILKMVKNEYKAITFSPNDIVVDIGANIGAFSAVAEKAARKVIAIEADSECCDVINMNVTNKTKVINAALVEPNGPKTINFYKGSMSFVSSCIAVRGREKIEVKTIGIDKILACNPTILKVDIEGHEYNWIDTIAFPKSVKQMAIELHLQKKDMTEKHDRAMANILKQGFKEIDQHTTKAYGVVTAKSYVFTR